MSLRAGARFGQLATLLALSACALDHRRTSTGDSEVTDRVVNFEATETISLPDVPRVETGDDVVPVPDALPADVVTRADVVEPPDAPVMGDVPIFDDVPTPIDIPIPPPIDVPVPMDVPVDMGSPVDVPPPRDVPPPMDVPMTVDAPSTIAPGGECTATGSVCAPRSECLRVGSGRSYCEVCGQLGQRACSNGGTLRCAQGTVETRSGTATGICVNLGMGNANQPGGTCSRDGDCSPMGQCDGYYGTQVCLTCGTPGLPCCCSGGCSCSSGTCSTGATDGWTVCR